MAFTAALKLGLVEEMESFKGLLPLLHISAHGNSEGLQLSNDEVILWAELSELLIPINRALPSGLVVAMSCCEGYSAIRMAMRPEQAELPFHALVGSPEKPTWAETAVGFTTFYHQLAIGSHITDAVRAMCVASNRHSFAVEWGESTRQGWLAYIKQGEVEKIHEDLREEAGTRPPEDTAKMALLEKGGN